MIDAHPDRRPSRLARTFYAGAGGIAMAVGGMTLLGTAQAAAAGCRLVFSQDDVITDPGAMPSGGCQQYADVVGIAAPIVVGLVLIVAAIRYLHADGFSTATKALAIPAGVVASAMPLLAYWQLHSYYRLAFGPVELAFFGLGIAIVAIGLVAAYRTALLILAHAPMARSAT